MKVKDVIISALHMLGRNPLADSLKNGSELNAEETETVDTLLYCYNAVEDEIARKYIPLTYSETMSASDGIFYFAAFARTPVAIKRVLSDGKEIGYEMFAQYMRVNAKKVTIEYEFSPSKKRIDGTSDYGAETGEYLIAAGMVAEYCLINGEIETSEQWEQKYRQKIDRAQTKLPSGGYLTPRRWV